MFHRNFGIYLQVHTSFFIDSMVWYCLWNCSPLSIPQMIHEWIWNSDGMILTGENRRTRRQTCPSATSTTINPKRIDPGSNLGHRGEKPATTQHYHPEDQHRHLHRRTSLKSHAVIHLSLDLRTKFRFSNFRCNEPCKFIPVFQFTNIIFVTRKNQPSSEGRVSASQWTRRNTVVYSLLRKFWCLHCNCSNCCTM
jgi:hypothetical protein